MKVNLVLRMAPKQFKPEIKLIEWTPCQLSSEIYELFSCKLWPLYYKKYGLYAENRPAHVTYICTYCLVNVNLVLQMAPKQLRPDIKLIR